MKHKKSTTRGSRFLLMQARDRSLTTAPLQAAQGPQVAVSEDQTSEVSVCNADGPRVILFATESAHRFACSLTGKEDTDVPHDSYPKLHEQRTKLSPVSVGRVIFH